MKASSLPNPLPPEIMSRHHRFSISLVAFLLGSACLPLTAATIGYYQFEDTPGVLEDSSAANRDLSQVGTGGGQVDSSFGNVPNPPDGSVANTEAMSFAVNRGFRAADISYADLTIEAFVNLASTTNSTRAIAAQFGATSTTNAFLFGVAANNSTTYPVDGTLFFQGYNLTGTLIAVGSPLSLTIGSNYYVAVSVDPGSVNGGADGTVIFYWKDLTNGGALQTASFTATGLNGIYNSSNVITIGSSTDGTGGRWSGVIDEVRLSDVALTSDQLLIVAVPEPSTYALVLGAFVLTGVVCRRKRAVC